MVKIPNRFVKIGRLKIHQGGLCACGCGNMVSMHQHMSDSSDLHHMLNDTKGNRQAYPLFIHSILNLQLVRHSCHMGGGRGTLGHIIPKLAARYERFLERHPRISAYVNGVIRQEVGK